MQSLDLHGFTFCSAHDLLASLPSAVAQCGAWVLQRRSLSATVVELRFETHPRSTTDLYAAILSAGVELTSSTQTALESLCNCHHHHSRGALPPQVITVRLLIKLLEDLSLPSLQSATAAAA